MRAKWTAAAIRAEAGGKYVVVLAKCQLPWEITFSDILNHYKGLTLLLPERLALHDTTHITVPNESTSEFFKSKHQRCA